MQSFCTLVQKHVEQIGAGKITEAQANLELEEMTISAEIEMSDQEFEEFFGRVMMMDYVASAQLSADGRPVPGNDPNRPN
jgi:hypothetical protein